MNPANATILYHAPGACSRVSMNALEEIGLEYEDRPIDLAKAEQRSPEYLAINPQGKIPALVMGGQVLTENAAIVLFLHRLHPQAGLLPETGNLLAGAQAVSDLIWCTSTIHPVVRSIRMPMRWTDGDPAPVHARGMAMFEPIVRSIAARLEQGGWWFGSDWSIIDVYLYWNYETARSGGFDLAGWPVLADHEARVRARPSFQRALAREIAAQARAGIQLPPGAKL